MRRLLERFSPDIVHAHYASSYGTLGRLCRFHPYVLSVWGSDKIGFSQDTRGYIADCCRESAAADHLEPSSKNMAEETQRYCNKPVSITRRSVLIVTAFAHLPSQNSEDDFVIVY